MIDWLGRIACARFINHPVFVVGGSRSGTIALLQAMGKHNQILPARTEDPFLTDLGGMVYNLEFCSEREKDYYLRTLRIPHAYVYETLRRLALESAYGPNFGLKQMIKFAVKEDVSLLKKRYWCTKTFPTAEVAHGLLKLYPGTKFVWILRNGLNVVLSRTKFREFRDLPFEAHCRHWAESIVGFSYLSDLPEATVVRQEELANDPELVFHRIFDHIGIEYDHKSAEFALTHHVHSLADESTKKVENVSNVLSDRPPPYQAWSQEQKLMFKDICGGAMRIAGYKMEF